MPGKPTMVPLVCPICGKRYEARKYDWKRGKCNVCSYECYRSTEYLHSRERTEKRLLAHRQIDPETGCWNYIGLRSKGYGKMGFTVRGKMKRLYAHRIAAWLWLGIELNDSRQVCHKCDNPSCFNPEHLFLGTNRDNHIDAVEKGRKVAPAHTLQPNGSLCPNSKLTAEQVLEIRRLFAAGGHSFNGLGRQFSVTGTTIRAIVRRKFWKHI